MTYEITEPCKKCDGTGFVTVQIYLEDSSGIKVLRKVNKECDICGATGKVPKK